MSVAPLISSTMLLRAVNDTEFLRVTSSHLEETDLWSWIPLIVRQASIMSNDYEKANMNIGSHLPIS